MSDAEPDQEAADATGTDKEPTRVPLPVIGVIAGLIVAAGVIAVLALTGFFAGDSTSPHAEAELLTAYQRSRNATYTLEGTFSRTLADGRRLESAALVSQRPPDEIRRQLGGTSGRMNGRRLNCNTDPNDQFTCATGAEVGPWDEMVTQELANLRSYFDPDHPVYTVTRQASGCFELKLVATLADPPYGVRSVMCFDDATGGMRSIELEHPNGAIDLLEASAVRAVAPEDFSLEGDKAFEGHDGGG